MLNFQIATTPSFDNDVAKHLGPKSIALFQKLRDHVYPQLKDCPYHGNNIKKLKNFSPESWRYRIGDYRIFYVIDGESKIVTLYAFALRKDAYRK